MTAPASARQRPRRADVRAAVLAAATEAFERDGYAGATLSGIAAAAGYTKGAVYSGFGAKADLFAEACKSWLASTSLDLMGRLRPVLAAGGERDELAASIAEALASAALDGPLRWQLLIDEFRAVALRDPEAAGVYRDLVRDRATFLTELFASDPYLGRLGRDALDHAALVILGLVNSFALEHAASPELVDRPTVTAVFDAFLRSVLP